MRVDLLWRISSTSRGLLAVMEIQRDAAILGFGSLLYSYIYIRGGCCKVALLVHDGVLRHRAHLLVSLQCLPPPSQLI